MIITALKAVPGVALAVILVLSPLPTAARQTVAQPGHAVTWPSQRELVESSIRDGVVDRIEQVPIGVTKPKRVYFKGDLPVRSAAWKPLMPGRYNGYWESYKSEIAAYELDKLLGLDMVPPAVERQIKGDIGAAVMWVEGVKGWDPSVAIAPPNPREWTRQVVRMKMFDQLIANIDRNQGNLLYDGDFHLILIDHSRAFTTTSDITTMARPTMFDAAVWDRLKALTLTDLQASLGKWVGKRELEALLKRRDRMALQLDKMIQERGEAAVLMK